MFDFSKYSSKPKCCDNSNKSVVGKMKDETVNVAIEEFVKLKTKMHSYLIDDISEHKKVKGVYKTVVPTVNNEYKDFFLSKKCLRHSNE